MLRLADRASLEVELPGAQSAPLTARRALRRWCGARVDDELLIDAELLVSELTTNVLAHRQGKLTLRARLDDDRVLVEIIDDGSGFERDLRRTDFWQIGGWGLGIVDALASRWGVRGTRTRTAVARRIRRLNTPLSAEDDAEFLKRCGLHARGRAPDPASPCPALPPP